MKKKTTKQKNNMKTKFSNFLFFGFKGYMDYSLILVWVSIASAGFFAWVIFLDFIRTTFIKL